VVVWLKSNQRKINTYHTNCGKKKKEYGGDDQA
jgi:hypothetical protein